ncbi:MAG: PqqD family protein [Acutalibacteraceae bacterium]
MKLKETFITQEMDGEQIMVATDGSFVGMVRNNATAAFIVDCLKTDTDKEAILDAMCRKYDAPREVMAADVDKVLNNLRKIGALEE